MTTSFDDILFLLSTDCFCAEVMENIPKEEIQEIKKLARKAIPEVVRGGDNYYMCADFSPVRMKNTQDQFLADIIKKISKQTAEKVKSIYDSLDNTPEDLSSASYTISSIASRLYWLADEHFGSPITAELLEVLSEIEPLGLESELHGFEWKQLWLDSNSDWDRYVMSLMDGIDDMPYLTFSTIKKAHLRLSHLSTWKAHLTKQKFAIISTFISTEAHRELDALNPSAASKIDMIIDNL